MSKTRDRYLKNMVKTGAHGAKSLRSKREAALHPPPPKLTRAQKRQQAGIISGLEPPPTNLVNAYIGLPFKKPKEKA